MRSDMHKRPKAIFFRRKAISDLPYQLTQLYLYYDKSSTNKIVVLKAGRFQQVIQFIWLHLDHSPLYWSQGCTSPQRAEQTQTLAN